jgi:beta-lactamase superfamily II metal-dependent hydrolase
MDPASITVRMYNVGFGDCFLLTFHYAASRDRHMLVDFGSAAAPKRGPKDYMLRVVMDIERQTKRKLDIVVATHRHCDHISGFATDGPGTGKIIASLKPDHVILPWTEDPNAAPDARTASAPSDEADKPDAKQIAKQMQSQFLGTLEMMHGVAAAAVRLSHSAQLRFLGENNLKNRSAVENLIHMGSRGKAWYVNAGMTLNDLLPGVKITVLGPPTLKQSDSLRTQRARDPHEFWQFCNFWSARLRTLEEINCARAQPSPDPRSPIPEPAVRWFIHQTGRLEAGQMLELVRELDGVLNNTSVILLVEAGKRKLLFPGDAQIENWAFALRNPEWRKLLADVNLYKVGHHGSLNATPKSLWSLFHHKSVEDHPERLQSLCSTRSGKHGSARSGTEVPRHTLISELRRKSTFVSTEDWGTQLSETVEMEL